MYVDGDGMGRMRIIAIRLLIAWIKEVTALLISQSNIFPHNHLKDLSNRADEVLTVLEKEIE